MANGFTPGGKTGGGKVLRFLLTAFVSAPLQTLPRILLRAAEQTAQVLPTTAGRPSLHPVGLTFRCPPRSQNNKNVILVRLLSSRERPVPP